jgi:hypothetical protein
MDPKQHGPLAEIIRNLDERIKEARMNGWLGEVQGLQTSRDAAAKKLVAVDRAIAQPGHATTAPTSLVSRPSRGRAISVTDNVRPQGGPKLFSASLQLTHGGSIAVNSFTPQKESGSCSR